jgi:hypothetical protein
MEKDALQDKGRARRNGEVRREDGARPNVSSMRIVSRATNRNQTMALLLVPKAMVGEDAQRES